MKKDIKFYAMYSTFISIIPILFGTGLLGTASISLAQGGTWTTKASMPTARFLLSTSVVDGTIYAIGGSDFNQPALRTVEAYGPATDAWSTKEVMPTARRLLSTSVVNGKIYAIGGTIANTDTDFRIVEAYDPATNTWTGKTNMPTARWGLSTSVVNGKIYAIGGAKNNPNTALSVVETYDPATNSWVRKAEMPTARSGLSTSAVNGKIYAIGGTNEGTVLSRVEEYDPATDRWRKKADMPSARRALSTSVVNGVIYAIGGTTTITISFRTVYAYDPATNTWTEKAEMPTARLGLATSTVNDKIYAVGGLQWFNGLVYSTVEEYDPGVATSVEDNVDRVPASFLLHQNYPNPFNPSTLIKYELPINSKVVLKIHNVFGQEVKTLVNGTQSAGSYGVVWNGKNNFGHPVSSGVYIYRIEAGNFINLRKMTFLK